MGFFDFLKPLFGSETGSLTKAIVKPVVQATHGFSDSKGNLTASSLVDGILKTPAALVHVAEKGVEAATNAAEKIPGVGKPLAEGIRDLSMGALEGAKLVSSVAEEASKVQSLGDLEKVKDVAQASLEKAKAVPPKGAMFAPKGIPAPPPMPTKPNVDPRRDLNVQPSAVQAVTPEVPRAPVSKRPIIDPRMPEPKRR